MSTYELVAVGYQPSDPVIEANVKKAENTTRITRIFGAVIASVGFAVGATGFGFSLINSSVSGGLASTLGTFLTVGIGLKMFMFPTNLYNRATLSQNIAEFANLSLPHFVYIQKGMNFHHIESLQTLGLATALDAQTMRGLCERYRACCWSLQSNITSLKCDVAKTNLQQMEQEWENLKSQLLTNAGIQV